MNPQMQELMDSFSKRELDKAIKALHKPIFQNKENPEIKEGNPLLQNTAEIKTPERQQLRGNIINEVLNEPYYVTGKERQKPKEGEEAPPPLAIVLIGGCGSAKTTQLAKMMKNKDKFLGDHNLIAINGDLIKKKIMEKEDPPHTAMLRDEYRDPRSNMRTDEEAWGLIIGKCFEGAMEQRKDMIIDGVDPPFVAEQLKTKGYEVRVICMALADPKIDAMKEACTRTHKRALRTGAFLPDEITLETHHGVANKYEGALEAADQFRLYDNSGLRPELILEKEGPNAEPVIQKGMEEKFATFEAQKDIDMDRKPLSEEERAVIDSEMIAERGTAYELLQEAREKRYGKRLKMEGEQQMPQHYTFPANIQGARQQAANAVNKTPFHK